MGILRFISLIIFTLVGLASFISHPCVAKNISVELHSITLSYSYIPKAEVRVLKIYGWATTTGWLIKYGERIALDIEVYVKENSPVPLEGFYLVICLEKPDGKCAYIRYPTDDVIYPGQCKKYTFKEGYRADQLGIWKYRVKLYTKDKQYVLDIDEGTFEVYDIPKAEVRVINIYGWDTTATDVVSPTLSGWFIKYGKKIALDIEVYARKDTWLVLQGFYICICLEKPDGTRVYIKQTIDDTIFPGHSKRYTFKSNYVADKIGTWKYVVTLCTKDKRFKIDEKRGTFEVYDIPKAEVKVEDIGKDRTVKYGQKIEFKVKICVKEYSLVPLDGFYIIITLQKPNGEWVTEGYTISDKINQGVCKHYLFKLSKVADQVGTWKYMVRLYAKDKRFKIDDKEGVFEVVENGVSVPELPETEEEALNIVGYTVAASMICTGLALILSRIVR